jgi:hypothetical protein
MTYADWSSSVSAGAVGAAADATEGVAKAANETAPDKTRAAASDDRTPLNDTGKR